MRVLIVNTSEQTGGAAIAANRLTEALNNNGVKARMMVIHKQTSNLNVISVGSKVGNWLRFCYERLVIWLNNLLSRKNLFMVSIANSGYDITKTREFHDADIIHLHWVNQGMLSLKDIRRILDSGKPVVWTMHDMWPLTSICHHAYECRKYEVECMECPFLRFPGRHDLSSRVWRRKQAMLADRQLQLVAVSEWLAEKARRSALVGNQSISVIPNSLDLSRFELLDRRQSRKNLGINSRYVIAFGAARIDDPIKGFNFLVEALNILVRRYGGAGVRGYEGTGFGPELSRTGQGRIAREDIHLLLFGNIRNKALLNDVPVACTHLGYVSGEGSLSEIYSASDAVVSSSYYETFGQTLIEAQACGSVPVSFDGSGQADIIRHKDNGFLAERLSAESLADGIEWALTTPHDRLSLRSDVVKRFSIRTVVAQYEKVYADLRSEQ